MYVKVYVFFILLIIKCNKIGMVVDDYSLLWNLMRFCFLGGRCDLGVKRSWLFGERLNCLCNNK